MPTKSLQRMAAPLVVSFTLRFLFTFVDMAYAAVLGDDNAAVAAIGLYTPIQNIYIAIWVGLSAGFTACLSNAFGHGDEARIDQLKGAMRRVLAFLIPALAALGIGVYLVIPHLGLEPRLADAFQIYATTLTVGMPLAGFWSIYPDSIVKAHQDTRSTMIAGLLSSFCNIVLNTVFVFAFGWGIFGLAIATVISRFAGLWYAVVRARTLEGSRQPGDAGQRDWPAPIATILGLAVPGALTYLLVAFESGVTNKVLAGLPDSTTAIASFAVFHQMLTLALMPAAATSVAVVPYVARVLPTGAIARIRRELRQTTLIMTGLAVGAAVIMGWLCAAPLAAFFVDARPGGDGAMPALDALRLLPLAALPAVPFFVLRPVFEAAQRPKVGVQISLARFVLLSPPLILAGRYWGPEVGLDGLRGMILGIALATGVAAGWALVRVRRLLADAR